MKNGDKILSGLAAYVLFLLLCSLLFSCKTQTKVQYVPVQSQEKIVERLVPVITPPDSSMIQAYLECDSNNQVTVKQLQETKSKLMESQFSLSNNVLAYKIITKHDTAYVNVTDTIRLQDVPIKVEVPVITNILNWWQKLLIWIGVITLASGIFIGGIKIAKFKFFGL